MGSSRELRYPQRRDRFRRGRAPRTWTCEGGCERGVVDIIFQLGKNHYLPGALHANGSTVGACTDDVDVIFFTLFSFPPLHGTEEENSYT
jgi:hypothetical protein